MDDGPVRFVVFVVLAAIGVVIFYNGVTAMLTGYSPYTSGYGNSFIKDSSGGWLEMLPGVAFVGLAVWIFVRGDEE